MPINRNRVALFTLLRCAPLVAALAAMFFLDDAGFRGLHAELARYGLLLLAIGSAVLAWSGTAIAPRAILSTPIVPLALLAFDLAFVGAVGTWLHVPEALAIRPRASLAFLTGYVITVLVAVSGRRPGPAAIGTLAGAMLLLLSESGFLRVGETPPRAPTAAAARDANTVTESAASGTADDPSGPERTRDVYLWIRIALLALAAAEASMTLGWLDAESHRRRAAYTVERELRARELIASEMAVFAEEAKGVGTIHELAEALLLHLRRHFPTAARGVYLEEAGERLALWEEAGRLSERLAEDRRLRMQEAVKEAGSTALVPRLEVRSDAMATHAAPDRLRTGVGVPVHATGRIGGTVFVGDAGRDAIPLERLGALAELGRQAGDAMRRLERTRDEQTRRTSILLGQMREGVLLLGPDGRVILSNPAGRRLLAVVGQPPEGPVALGDVDAGTLAAIPPGGVRRTSASGTDAEGRAVRISAVAMGAVDGGRRLGTLVTLSDVTEEEQARARLMQAEKLSVVGQTLASVAHELNNPLAAIVGYADLLAESDIPGETGKLLQRIREQATRTSRIVKNLLNVARRRGPERTRVSLNEIATSVVDLFTYDARLHNITLVPVLDADLPPIVADRHALQQILVNLCQNGIHALRATGRPGRIEIRTRADRTYAYLEIRDDGPGVPPALRARVFEAFFTTKGPDEGTGLGLAISRGIAREHGGDLLLEDRAEGAGAQFTLRLPLDARVPSTAVADERAIPEGVPARVLVVDDEAAVRDSLVQTLGRLGAQVDGVGTPGEAERLLEGVAAYDAVLLDVRLPGRSGLDVHRALKARSPELASRVIFMTGDLVNDEVIAAVRATGNTLLEKPFSASELKTALGRSAAH